MGPLGGNKQVLDIRANMLKKAGLPPKAMMQRRLAS